jgi:hypothetical protein
VIGYTDLARCTPCRGNGSYAAYTLASLPAQDTVTVGSDRLYRPYRSNQNRLQPIGATRAADGTSVGPHSLPRLQGATGWAAVSWTLKRVWVAPRLDGAGARRAATTRGALLGKRRWRAGGESLGHPRRGVCLTSLAPRAAPACEAGIRPSSMRSVRGEKQKSAALKILRRQLEGRDDHWQRTLGYRVRRRAVGLAVALYCGLLFFPTLHFRCLRQRAANTMRRAALQVE